MVLMVGLALRLGPDMEVMTNPALRLIISLFRIRKKKQSIVSAHTRIRLALPNSVSTERNLT